MKDINMTAVSDAQGLLNTGDEQLHSSEPWALNRRQFLTASMTAGFVSASMPVLAQAIKTDAEGLQAGSVTFERDGFELHAYRARPAGVQHAPVVLVISEIFGVHEYIQDICRRLAKQGYYAIATDLFERQGNPANYATIADLQANLISKVPDAQVLSDLDSTVAFAHKEGANTQRLAVTGFCWGGRITWLYTAHQPKVKAGVAWYGRLVGNKTQLTPRHPIDLAANLNAPVLGL